MNRYDAILPLPRPVSRRHPPMPLQDRAKIFAPFAALKGYEDAVADKRTLLVPRTVLTRDARQALDARLRQLADAIACGSRPTVRLLCFMPLHGGPDGQYNEVVGRAARMDRTAQRLLVNGRWIALSQVDQADSPLFTEPTELP